MVLRSEPKTAFTTKPGRGKKAGRLSTDPITRAKSSLVVSTADVDDVDPWEMLVPRSNGASQSKAERPYHLANGTTIFAQHSTLKQTKVNRFFPG
ncbi:hypothetical protein E2320_003409 [Naja naja]|nr:hypothetical protein E2320_003409 [Naja naja]